MLKHWEDYEEFSGKLRGRILTAAVNLEIVIDQFIANHFCIDSSKSYEFKKIMIWDSNISFKRKTQILEYILKTHEKEFLKIQKTFLNDLTSVYECRNIIAHRFLDHRGAGKVAQLLKDKKIVFKNFKASKPIEYTEQYINEIEQKAVNCANALYYWKGNMDYTAFPA